MIIVNMDMVSGIRNTPLHSSDCNCLFNAALCSSATDKSVGMRVKSFFWRQISPAGMSMQLACQFGMTRELPFEYK